MCACFDLEYVLSDLFPCRTRSAYVYNGYLTWYDVLLIPRVTQAWNTVICPSFLYFTVEWIHGVNSTLYHARHTL